LELIRCVFHYEFVFIKILFLLTIEFLIFFFKSNICFVLSIFYNHNKLVI